MSIETKSLQYPTPDQQELGSHVDLQAVWVPTVARGEKVSDEDCGELSVMLAGASRGESIDNQITGDILPEADGLKMATIYRSHIDPEYRGRGIGSKLYKAFTRLAVEHGADQLGAVSPSAAAMRTRLRVFDATRLKFYDMTDEDVEEVVTTEVEISAEECQKRIEARERFDQHMRMLQEKYGDQISERMTKAEEAQGSLFAKEVKPFSVVVDLHGLDVSDWEPEVPVSKGEY